LNPLLFTLNHMSSNVGLTTPRGSGTSGYVQRNLSHLKPRDQDRRTGPPQNSEAPTHTQRQPDPAILEHERKRRVEAKIFELRDQLEEEGVDEDEIEERADKLRTELEKANEGSKVDVRGLKSHQVHDLAKAKIEETERVRKALGIGKDYEEGGHWKKQEERRNQTEKKFEEPEERDSEVERKEVRQRKRRSYRDRDGERWEDRRSRTRSPDS
jgi:hypothetical protein